VLENTIKLSHYSRLHAKRVLLITGVFPPKIGGPSGQAYELLKLFKGMNVIVGVLTFGSGDTTDIVFDSNSFIIRTSFLHSKIKNYLTMFYYIFLSLLFYKPCVIHQQTGIDNLSILTLLLAKLFRVKSVVKFTGDWTWESTPEKKKANIKYEDIEKAGFIPKIKTAIQKLVFSNYDFIWSTSSFQTTVLRKKFGQNIDKIIEVPNFLKIESTAGNEERIIKKPVRLISVSRFVPWKRVDEVIETLHELKKNRMEATLTIIGGGDEQLYLDYLHEVEKRQLTDYVRFIRDVDPREIKNYYLSSDIYVSATEYEPFGIVFLEAMEAGLPVISKKTGGVVDIIDEGINGYLINGDDFSTQAASKIQKMIENPQLYSYCSRNALELVKNYDIKLLGKKLIEDYLSRCSACY
jgi:glycosyltransferase involved in cell wall biosynthesis